MNTKSSTDKSGVNDVCCPKSLDQGIPLKLHGSNQQRRDIENLKGMHDCVVGSVSTSSGPVPRVSTEWSFADYWGAIRSRVGAYRMKYSIPAGLYAVGDPDENAHVFISANYKLSFDKLRRSLKGIHGWILVLDTKSINVWCAAGKGTFGTEELIHRIAETQLDRVVEHKKLIVPQLGAVGINAASVKKRTKFHVYFGPVYAKDIPRYIAMNYKATREMRTIRFTLLDRIVLTPMEINPALKKYPFFAGVVLLLFGLQPSGILFKDAISGGLPFLLLGLLAVVAGAFLTPTLLPLVPFRSFAIKGWIVGIVTVFLAVDYFKITAVHDIYLRIMTYVFFPFMVSYIALQFTGSTTYTGKSGVEKELRIAIPLYIITTVVALVLTIFNKLDQWGIV